MTDRLDDAIVYALRTEDGKRVFMWLLEMTSIYADPFANDQTEATSYALGRQSVGRRVIARLNEIDPTIYPKLLFDAADIRAADAREAERTEEKDEDDA